MAAPVIASETTVSNSGLTHNLTVPAGMVAGDLDVIYGNVWGSDGNSIPVPADYTLIHRQLHSSDGEFVVACRIAPAVPATVNFATESGLNFAGRRLRITGAAATLLAALNAQASAQENVDDPDSPSVTTTVNECLVLLALADTWGDSDAYAEPVGTTQQGTNQDQDSATLCLAFFTQTTAGATGAKEWTGTSGNDEFGTSTIAIAPPAAAGTTHDIASTLTGQGSLGAGPTRQLAAAASVTGQGSLSASASAVRSTAAGLAGQGTLTAGAELSVAPLDVAATLTGRATLLAGASAYRGVTAALSGAGTLVAGASAARTGAAVFAGTGLLTLAPTAARNVSATLAGGSVLTATAETTGEVTIAATLTGDSALFAAPAALRRATVALTGIAAMTAAAGAVRPVAASLAGAGTLEASPEVARNVAAALSGRATLTAGAEIAQATVDIAATLTGHASLSAFARLVLNASIRLDGGSSFAATALDVAGNPTRLRSRRPRTALDTALPQAMLATRVRQEQQSRAPARALRSRAPDNEQIS